jgi:hypothetical protein
MFKFLRKYNKWILAVGGALLMIVFLVPQAITSLSQRAAVGGAVWATVGANNEDVPASARRQVERELAALERLQRAGIPLGITEQPEHWYLLVREAEQAGFVGGRAIDQIPAEQAQVLFSVAGATPDTDAAISKSLAVGRMIQMYQNAAQLSDARLRAEAARLFHAVEGRTVVLEAEASDAAPAPSEAEIAAQFERFRDVVPGDADAEGGNPAGFGYRLPDRFKVEMLTIGTDGVRAMIEASDALDGVALFKHWERHAGQRGFPSPVDPSVDPPAIIRDDLLTELVGDKMGEIERFANDRLLGSRRRLASDEAYYKLPDDWASERVDLAVLGREMQDEFEGLPLPVYRAIGDRWLTIEDVRLMDDLGQAATDKFGTTSTDAATLIAATRAFGGDRVAIGPLRNRLSNDLIFFRITATDPSRPPHDVDEVRDEVVADLKRQADFERLLGMTAALEGVARQEGLLTVAMDHGVEMRRLSRVSLYNPSFLDFQIQNNLRLQATPSSLPVVGADETTIGAIVDRALELSAGTPLEDLPRADRTFVVPVESKLAVMIVELTGQTRLDRERYERMTAGNALQAMLLGEELSETDPPATDVFTYESLAARHNFEVKRRETVEDDAESESESDEGDAAAAAGP